MNSSRSGGLVFSALIVQQILGGLTFPIAKLGLEVIDPFTFAFYRFGISSIILLLIVFLRKKQIPIEKKDFIKIAGLGLLIIPFNQLTYLYGQKLTAAGHGALLFATVPIWIFIGALFHLKEKFILRRALGVIIGFAGVIIILLSGEIVVGREYLLGDIIILIAVIAWASYSIFGKPLVQKYGAFRITAYALSFGSALYFPFGLYSAINYDYSQSTPEAWLSVLYVAIGVSVLAYVLWYWVLKQRDASKIAVYHNLQPFIAVSVAYIMLGETPELSLIIGGIIVITGVLITETKYKRKKMSLTPNALPNS